VGFFDLFSTTITDPHELARQALQRHDYRCALELYKQLAEGGDAHAQYNVALMYQRAEGVPQDISSAVRWYARAAGQGLMPAQAALGNMYSELGVIADIVRDLDPRGTAYISSPFIVRWQAFEQTLRSQGAEPEQMEGLRGYHFAIHLAKARGVGSVTDEMAPELVKMMLLNKFRKWNLELRAKS
jgi:hypothetical protein